MNSKESTIAAIATPPGIGAISIIRVSGPESIFLCDKIFRGKTKLTEAKSHTIHYGKIVSSENEIIDDTLISVFKAPHSYTGEESVEISFHGNPLIAQKILSSLFSIGVEQATPGEFTKRAFLNGKIDLSQAEAVIDLITSRSETALKGARNQLDGLLSKKVGELRSKLVNISSLIELELDFAEEDVEFVDHSKISELINQIISEMNELIETFRFGKVINEGINVALVGMPNVGKSSLLNYLVKEARAIVSEIPGTTRDIIREEVTIDGILYRLFDTAGIRETKDIIEKEGVERSKSAIQNADVVLFLNDIEQGFSKELYQKLLTLTTEDKILKVINKIDLSEYIPIEAEIGISAKTGAGIGELFNKLKEKAIGKGFYTEKSAIITSIRHLDSLKKAVFHLEQGLESVSRGMSGEFISVDLRNAELALGEIIGEVTSDDILNNIFSKFCIGK